MFQRSIIKLMLCAEPGKKDSPDIDVHQFAQIYANMIPLIVRISVNKMSIINLMIPNIYINNIYS